jgi:uncharacterized OB-fold protein
MSDAAPGPEVDHDSRGWWDGLREERIVLQRCERCRRERFPPMPGCPYCGHDRSEEAEAPSRGTLYSYVVVHHAFDPAFSAEVPYVIGTVELENGVRIPARIVAPVDEVQIDDELRARFVAHEEWTELRFGPAGAGS